jgi:hypothetical protein
MKQISGGGGKPVHVVFKYLFRSLLYSISRGGDGRRYASPSPPPFTSTLFPSWSGDISFKDDVNVILLLGVSYMAGHEWVLYRL